MPPKRPSGDELSGRQRKRIKTQTAREIGVQGPSNESQKLKVDATKGLPSTIDVEKFVEARGYEIQAMEKALKTASNASTHRVWQTLPRHLRRRAASHDVRRVPVRLRDKARAEMDPPKAKKGKKPSKRGKTKQETKTASFERRQRDKTWLETHMWHAKRMHMEDRWGYRLAIKTTEKAFRPSFRAATRGCILHDASYIGTIQLKGKQAHLKVMLDICCDAHTASPGSIRYTSGSRVLETRIYRPNAYPLDMLAPVRIIWQTKTAGEDETRLIWIRVHPGAFNVVFAALTEASSLAMSKVKDADPEAELELSDMRGHLNEFEIMGPASGAVIAKALSMVMSSEGRKEAIQFWHNLKADGSSSKSPRGLVAGIAVHDPRIKAGNEKSKLAPSSSSFLQPSQMLAISDIWSAERRLELAKPKYSKADIDNRRGHAANEGRDLHPGPEDARIPILLVQRSLSPASNDQTVHGWSIIFPRGWGMPFLSALTYSSVRVAGLRDCHTQSLESGVPYFPDDYPGTTLYDSHSIERAKEELARWERTPPAKRAAFQEPAALDPWLLEWTVDPTTPNKPPAEDPLPAQRGEGDISMAGPSESRTSPWIFRTSDTGRSILDLAKAEKPEQSLNALINAARASRGLPVPDAENRKLYEMALVPIEVDVLGRGVPQDLSRVYALSDAKFSTLQNSPREEDGHVAMSSESGEVASPVGYVTTGAYSLSRGRGYGIGYISLDSAVKLEQQRQRCQSRQHLVCLRNRLEPTRWATEISFLSI